MTRAATGRVFARRRGYDVVFYTPRIGQILTAGHFPPGGTETQVLTLAKALARRGVRIAIVVFATGSEMPTQVDGVRITARPPQETGRGIVGKVIEIMRIWRALRSVPSRTIVHMGGGLELGVIAAYARLACRRLVFASASVGDFEDGKTEPNPFYNLVYGFGARLADAVVVQTEEQVELCAAAFGRRAVVVKSLALLADSGNEDPVAFLWVGRLVSYKRPLEYIALARAVPEAKFWMVGVPIFHDDGDRLLAEAVSAEAKSVPNLELLSPRPHTEVQSLMAHAVASVNTSDFEGMPNALLEAWSRGVPALVLSYDPNGVISGYGLGAFAHGSPTELIALARELWQTRHDRDAMSWRCRGYIQEHHAPEIVIEQWLRVISAKS